MIGSLSEFSGTYLQALGLGSIVLLGVPLVVAPLSWARVLRWPLPAETRLAVYLGRCLGSVICVLSVFAFVAAATPAVQPFFFQIVLANVVLMVAVHTWGAARKIQPMSESLETFAWLAILVVGGLCYPG